MSLLSLPDLVGMLILMSVLVSLRRKQKTISVDLWVLGLFFILLEALAVAVLRGSPAVRAVMHVTALDAYVLAGITFGWAAREDVLPGVWHLPIFFLPAAPLFVLTTLYGLDVVEVRLYLYTIWLSLVLGLLYVVIPNGRKLPFKLALTSIHVATWLPMLLMARQGNLRWVVYWGLTCLYLLVAFCFRGRVRKGRVGGLTIVAGFTIWAMCFLFHPLVRGFPVYDGIVEQVWNMQKFVVIMGMVLTLLEDETELRHAEAMHDALTGLPNRRLFEDRLQQAMDRSQRSGMSTALFILDLDGFKAINDMEGHSAGDVILCAAAKRLLGKVRSSDTLARLGGDEFCVIISELSRRADCERIAATLRAAVNSVTLPGPGRAMLSGSVGYAMFPADANNAFELYALADKRMYEQKRGRGSVPGPLAVGAGDSRTDRRPQRNVG